MPSFCTRDTPSDDDAFVAFLAAHPAPDAVWRAEGDAFFRAYAHALSADCADRSFWIDGDGGPVAAVRCGIDGSGVSDFGRALRVVVDPGLGRRRRAAVWRCALDRLAALGSASGLSALVFDGGRSGGSIDAFGAWALAAGATPSVSINAVIDVRRSLAEIKSRVRKSYKSLLTWGDQNLEWRYSNGDTPDAELFAAFQAFHRRIAGRQTRTDASWRVMAEEAAAGRAELAAGFRPDGALLAAALFRFEGDVAHYSSAVYEREAFDKPLGHSMLWTAVRRAQARGIARFDLGALSVDPDRDEKAFSISEFKRAFATDLESRILWHFPVCADG